MEDSTDILSLVTDASVIELGDAVAVECPECGEYSSAIMVGVGPIIRDDEVLMLGTFGYQYCGHIMICPHLAKRCALIQESLDRLDGRIDADLLFSVAIADHEVD
jgi:hypothetical protein